MMACEISSALSLPLEQLAEGFAAGFAGYVVQVAADVRAFEQRLRVEHIHLADSHVVLREGRVVALSLVARRGDKSRVAALGVVPELRRSGLGRVLTQRVLEEAWGRGDREVLLEVIESNAPAVALYSRLGFVSRRRLVGWEGSPPAQPAPVEEVPLVTALAAVLQYGVAGLPWQLAPETLAGHTTPTRAFRLGEAVAVVTEAGAQDVVLRALVVPHERRRRGEGSRLVRALAAHLPNRRWRIPAIVPEGLGADFLTAHGLRRQALTQLEMGHPR